MVQKGKIIRQDLGNAVDVAGAGLLEDAAIKAVTDGVVKDGKAANAGGRDLVDVGLVGLERMVNGVTRGPSSAVDDGSGLIA